MQKTITEISKSLQKYGFHLTPQRMAIYNFLADSKDHPTANEIFKELKTEFPSLSLATVYNTLEMFAKVGFVNVLGSIGDGKVHYDTNREPHINLACISCHKIIDLPSEHVALMMDEISETKGYDILGTRILIYGICSNCQQNQRVINKK